MTLTEGITHCRNHVLTISTSLQKKVNVIRIHQQSPDVRQKDGESDRTRSDRIRSIPDRKGYKKNKRRKECQRISPSEPVEESFPPSHGGEADARSGGGKDQGAGPFCGINEEAITRRKARVVLPRALPLPPRFASPLADQRKRESPFESVEG
ncbi:hypothetical protein GW17_00047632 [Ensete ventricosum]|uniref:Uncharacterized protein n=1 Tax=Ensete ventricosum TaxID=4639 RepID=A0A444CWG1_ENSVE|nr:hypothetical protein B296_00016704 [Ensete ventricosum]RWV90185.1 hypothetical protein GW17_00047632 [Ensete ventricosum]